MAISKVTKQGKQAVKTIKTSLAKKAAASKAQQPEVNETPEDILNELKEDIKIEEKKLQESQSKFKWDVPKNSDIDYFDASLSYELTGYIPINDKSGLDFNPKWFTEARDTYEKTNKYCAYLFGSKKFREFWTEEYRRCRDGYTSHGYTITGFHYFFLNYYTLPLINKVKEAGSGRPEGFPDFTVAQYTWWHYLDFCKKKRKNAALMKARGLGFSECMASAATCEFTIIRESMSIITCYDAGKVDRTLKKVWHAMAFLDKNTQGGMSKNKQIRNTTMEKTSGEFIMQEGTKVQSGWQSTVQGIVADDPQKIRGDRADLLIYDEAGSWPLLEKAVIQGEALLTINGNKFGLGVFGGTGGDKGPNLEGLRHIYYDPRAYEVMPYRHNCTASGEYVETGFFLPAYSQIYETMDERGYCDPEASKAILQKARDLKLANPSAYLIHCAEYCWTAEEAFAMEGENKFNKVLIAEQLANIRLHKIGPRPQHGNLSYIFSDDSRNIDKIMGFSWKPDNSSKLQILEHPLWTQLYRDQLVADQKKHPDRTPDEIVNYSEMHDLYIAGIDGIDIGKTQTSVQTKDPSDFCIVIMKRAMGSHEPTIVAIYKDRPNEINTAYKIALMLIKYYNAKVNVEATRVGFLNWVKTAGQMRYFMKRPRATLADIRTGSTKAYGTPATAAIIEMQTDLIQSYVEDYCHNIWFEEVLDELERYNDENKRKFDIIAALGMVMLADQELNARVPTKVEDQSVKFQDYGWWTDEKGYKHHGVIPEKTKPEVRYSQFPDERRAYDPYRIESSDPRLNFRPAW